MGLKDKAKVSRRRALMKVVLFIVRVQKSQKKKQSAAEQMNFNLDAAIPLLRCSTVPTIPIFTPEASCMSTSPSTVTISLTNTSDNSNTLSINRCTSQRSSRDWNACRPQRSSFLNVWDDHDERCNHLLPGSGTLISPHVRSRASSNCSFNSRSSGGVDSVTCTDDDTEDGQNLERRKFNRFVEFTTMHKPYTLNGFGELTAPGSTKCNVKNISVNCNSVMGDPKRLSKKLIRRGSTTEIRDDRFAVARPSTSSIHSQQFKKKEIMGRSLIRQQTADAHSMRPLLPRCTSDENVANIHNVHLPSESDVSPTTARKFVKRKSSADLLLASCGDATSGQNGGFFGTSTLDRSNAMTSSVSSNQLSKAEKKKLEKMKENMKQLLELFTAVEQDDIGKVKSILHHGEVDVNGTNMDELTLLDVSTMLNHTEVALLLLKHGAQENQRMSNLAHRTKHLQSMIDSAQTKLAEFTLAASRQPAGAAGSSATLSKSLEKQMSNWESRLHTLKKMRNNVENSTLPPPPKNVTLSVSSSTSLTVSFEPPDQQNGVVVTKYKIEWSQQEDFSNSDGNICIFDLRRLEATISNLTPGISYYIRVSAGTYKGFGEAAISVPLYAVPSSWRDIDHTLNRGAGRLEAITELFHELRKLKKTDLWERIAYSGDAALKKKKHSGVALKNLFSSHAKFQKNPKRGVYLASILYKEDKVLCTVDDCLPVVEVDETVPATLGPDFQWFMKLSCAWEDMRSLNFDLDLVNQSPSLIFRLKLLEAAAAMQAGLGVQDLGRLHSTPIIDNKGVTVLITVQYVHDSKSVQGLAVRWLSMNKLLKKQSTSTQEKELSTMDVLINNLLNFLNFYESTYIPLDRGLYLGYVKLHTSINQISIVVPENLPSVLPFVFIRDNPHVSKEEWDWLRIMDTDRVHDVQPTASQLAFHWALASAAKVLLNDLDVNDDQIMSHRIYRLEVVEIHSDVSFILLVPSHDDVCLPPGQPRMMIEEKRGCVILPVPMFEVAHLCTYQPDFIALYCRLSVFLEFYSVVLQQLHRQTLNEEETKTYRQLLDTLTGHQQRLEDVWKATRWITSVVTAARDRQLRSSLPLSILLAYAFNDVNGALQQPSQKNLAVASANGSVSPSFRRLSNEPESTGTMRRRQPNAANDDSQPGTSTGIRHRRVSSGEQSLSEDQAEENSDVGYHSDQSIEKLANGAAVVHPLAASNPTYDFPENLIPNRADYVNCDVVNDEKTLLNNDNVDYLVNKLNFVQRTIPETTSKLVEARYGKYEPPVASGRGRLRSDDTEMSARKPTPAITYRTEIAVGENSGWAVFDVRFKTAPPSSTASQNRRHTHEYVNIPALSIPTPTQLANRRKSGCVVLPITLASTASDSEASCSSTSTASSARSRLQPRSEPVWIPCEENNRMIEEDLSVIDKLYAEATSRFPVSNSSSSISTPTPTPLVIQKSSASPRPASSASSTRSAASTSSDRSRSTARVQSPQSGVLRVYAAYPCGLAKGTSVKLHVTPKTTAKEVVILVMRQLNKAVEMKGLKGPFYSDEEINDFVLVAVIGARERCLRDDFPPLELQNPWCKGKLFIRRKNDLLAALEFGNEAKV